MKVAITGGDGFLGRVVIKKLKKNKVSVTSFNKKEHNLLKVGSLKNFVAGKDIIIHLAAVNKGENLNLIKTNILGTLCLLEAMAKFAPDARIIFSSSFQVYLNQGIYGISKRTGEDLIIEYTKKSNLKGIILRISNIYGPGGKPFYNSVIATFAHLIKKGMELKINGDGSSKRDFVYVDDVADAIVKSAQKHIKTSFEILDICSGQETTLKEMLDILEKVSCKKFQVMYNTEVKDKPWPTGDKNFTHALHLIGWKPTTTLESGLKKVMQND